MTARKVTTVRLGFPGLQRIQRLVEETGASQSEVVRQLLAEALRHQPSVDAVRARLTRDRGY